MSGIKRIAKSLSGLDVDELRDRVYEIACGELVNGQRPTRAESLNALKFLFEKIEACDLGDVQDQTGAISLEHLKADEIRGLKELARVSRERMIASQKPH